MREMKQAISFGDKARLLSAVPVSEAEGAGVIEVTVFYRSAN